MACEHPKKIINRRYKDMTFNEVVDYAELNYGMVWPPDYIVDVPCGYCFSCQKSSNNQYRIRLMYEIRKWPPNTCLFVTLTFDDENLMKYQDNPNKAVRLFLDRMRKRFGKQIRHWFIGEYGTKKGRPHYHGILFNVPRELSTVYSVAHPGDHPVVRELWQYGFVFVGYVSDKTCSYITKYLTKSLNGKKVRPRVISSHGIGDNYLSSDESRLHKAGNKLQPFMHLNGFPQALPRYYYNKIFSEVDKQNMVLDNFISPPPFVWQGVRYSTEEERNSARVSTFEGNKSSGLTPYVAPPVNKVMSSEERFKKRLEQFENEFAL